MERHRPMGCSFQTMVTLHQLRRAAEREEQFRRMQYALRETFKCVAEEPVPERLRALVDSLERKLKDAEPAPPQGT